eukprot:TRINITY_DN6624_c0_g1_i1.p1 TRINITY_DN6624_c0_g1~~TRINITY_DN6624_c0_g1_i1.p1  ORF type:complete len:507 (-),score=104.45 TRINITY_DN6624_c0_g1_i1:624-2144(-)
MSSEHASTHQSCDDAEQATQSLESFSLSRLFGDETNTISSASVMSSRSCDLTIRLDDPRYATETDWVSSQTHHDHFDGTKSVSSHEFGYFGDLFAEHNQMNVISLNQHGDFHPQMQLNKYTLHTPSNPKDFPKQLNHGYGANLIPCDLHHLVTAPHVQTREIFSCLSLLQSSHIDPDLYLHSNPFYDPSSIRPSSTVIPSTPYSCSIQVFPTLTSRDSWIENASKESPSVFVEATVNPTLEIQGVLKSSPSLEVENYAEGQAHYSRDISVLGPLNSSQQIDMESHQQDLHQSVFAFKDNHASFQERREPQSQSQTKQQVTTIHSPEDSIDALDDEIEEDGSVAESSRQASGANRRSQLTLEQRENIVNLHLSGRSLRDISKRIKCTLSAVQYTVKKFAQHRTTENLPKSGRLPLLRSVSDETFFSAFHSTRARSTKQRLLMTAKKLQDHVGVIPSHKTIYKELKRRLNGDDDLVSKALEVSPDLISTDADLVDHSGDESSLRLSAS